MVLMEPGYPERRPEATSDSAVQCLKPQHGIEMWSILEIDSTITVCVGRPLGRAVRGSVVLLFPLSLCQMHADPSGLLTGALG